MKSTNRSTSRGGVDTRTRLLFVDDEESIRATLPPILSAEGFQVSVAASVAEALKLINYKRFEVLLTDLNIGRPGDGFTVVSAMRCVQPAAATFILTGYPDFKSALEALRKQVDDYLTKPADIRMLVATIKDKLHNRRLVVQEATKRVSDMIRDNQEEIIHRWLKEVNADAKLRIIPLSDQERIKHLPALLNDLADALEAGTVETPAESLRAAALHGEARAKQGYTISLLVLENRILHRVIAAVLQDNLLTIDLSSLIGQALRVGEGLHALLEESVRALQCTEIPAATGRILKALPTRSKSFKSQKDSA